MVDINNMTMAAKLSNEYLFTIYTGWKLEYEKNKLW